MIHIFTKQGCGFCVKAKQLLENANISYKLTDITDDDTTKYKLLDDPRVKQYGHRTFPFVFKEDEFVGGFTELKEMFDNGFLDKNNQDF